VIDVLIAVYPSNRQERCNLRAYREIDQRPYLVDRDRVEDPSPWNEADSKYGHTKYPGSCLSVQGGKRRQDRGILDALLGAYLSLKARRSALCGPSLRCSYRFQDPTIRALLSPRKNRFSMRTMSFSSPLDLRRLCRGFWCHH